MLQKRKKSATITIRVDPAVKEALRTAAAAERRSLANMVEVAILEYCRARPTGEAHLPRRKART